MFFFYKPLCRNSVVQNTIMESGENKKPGHLSQVTRLFKILSGNPAIRRQRTRGFPSPDYSGFGFFTSKF